MKFFLSIKNYFFSEEKKLSSTQLKEDFGYFPPFPLSCKNIDREFNIIRIRGIGIIFIKLIFYINIFNLLKLVGFNIDLLPKKFHGKIHEFFSKKILEINNIKKNFINLTQ